MKLTFIGNGNMARALIQGLKDSFDIEVIGRNTVSLDSLKQDIPSISTKVLKEVQDISGKNIILCVKPYSLHQLKPHLKGTANSLYSVLAGTSIQSLKDAISSKSYIRCMPNLASTYQKSMTTIVGDEQLKSQAVTIFDNIGKTLYLSSENELDIATAIAGSGPAFLALVAEGLADGGVRCGLKREDSQTLVAGLFDGFAKLIQHEQPSCIKDNVMSPAGTTAQGVATLEKANIRSAMIEAINDAFKKAKQLRDN